MSVRTPVVGKLPKLLIRDCKPLRTPVVQGQAMPMVSELLARPRLSAEDVDAAVEMAGAVAEDDPAWAAMATAALRDSCALFAAEKLRGPKVPPYNGHFILGQHHMDWDDLIPRSLRLNILAARDHGKCAVRGSLIQVADGRRVPIEAWTGGEVVAFDQEAVALQGAWAGQSECQGMRACVRVRTRTGRRETVTLNHRFFTVDGEVFASDLKIGMRIAVPRTLSVEGKTPLRPGEAWLLGLLIGDGGFRSSSVTLSATDPMIVNEAGRACAGLGWELHPDKGGTSYRFHNGWRRRGSCAAWARSLGIMGKKSEAKFAPEPMFAAPNADVADFIAGMIDSDGNVNTEGGGAVEVYSISKRLLRDVQHLLTRLGVVAVLAAKKGRYKGTEHRSWRLTIRGASIGRLAAAIHLRSSKRVALGALAREQAGKDEGGSIDLLPKTVYGWLRHGKDWFRRRGGPKFERRYDLTRSKARKLADLEGNERLRQLADAEVLWDAVVSIEDAGEQETWAIQVPGFESYVGQDVINHNSYFWTFAYPIWRCRFWKGSMTYIFSATQTLSEAFLKAIKEEILENPELADMIPLTSDRFWSAKEIRTRHGSVIRARGYGVKVRGGHPDYIVCDDVLGDDDIYSETIRRKNIDYYLSSITNMVVPGGQIVVVGTPMHQADLYAALRETGEYICRKYPALDKSGEPLFPERYNAPALAAKRRELKSEARFAREYMCEPLSDEASLFPSKLFEGEARVPYALGMPAEYWENRGCLRYTGVDIALSAEVGADWFWIFTIAIDPQGVRWIANLRRGKGWSFTRQIDEIKDEFYLMRPEVIHIEANQAQRVWSDEVQRTSDIPVRRFFTTGIGGRQPLEGWKKGATQISVNKNHLDRGVPSLRMTLEAKKWRIPRGDAHSIELTDTWIGEMGAMGWINGKVQSVAEHDDAVMACLPPGQLITTRGGLVPIEVVQVGDQVLTHAGKWRCVLRTMSRDYEGTVYRVKAAGMPADLVVTAEHPVFQARALAGSRKDNWRIRPSVYRWAPPGELHAGRKLAGDFLLAPGAESAADRVTADLARFVEGRKPPGFATWHVEHDAIWWRQDRRCPRRFKFTEAAGLLVGLYLAEGSCGHNGAAVQFALHERESYIVDFLREILRERFAVEVKSDPTDEHGQVARCSSVIAHGFFAQMGKKQSKQLPWAWLDQPQEFLAGVLRGWLVGDGCRQGNKLRGVSYSRNLIEQMRLIAIRLGLRVSICPFTNENPAWEFDLDEVGTAELLSHPSQMELARWGAFRKPRRHSNGRTLPVPGGLAHRVAAVTAEPYFGRVYNLEVEADHSYVAGGLAVHNCWMADTAARMGGVQFGWLEGEAAPPRAVLAAPRPSEVIPGAEHDMAEQERRALAAVQQGQLVECSADHYFMRIRSALQSYAGQMVDSSQNVRAVIALEEVRRLDKLFRIGDHMKELDNAERGSYGRPSSAEWKPDEGAPTPQSLGRTAE